MRVDEPPGALTRGPRTRTGTGSPRAPPSRSRITNRFARRKRKPSVSFRMGYAGPRADHGLRSPSSNNYCWQLCAWILPEVHTRLGSHAEAPGLPNFRISLPLLSPASSHSPDSRQAPTGPVHRFSTIHSGLRASAPGHSLQCQAPPLPAPCTLSSAQNFLSGKTPLASE